jgi:hypothetical protein
VGGIGGALVGTLGRSTGLAKDAVAAEAQHAEDEYAHTCANSKSHRLVHQVIFSASLSSVHATAHSIKLRGRERNNGA